MTISVRKLTLILAAITLAFVPLNYALRAVEQLPNYAELDPERFLLLLDVDGETTIPTWFNALQFMLAGVLLGVSSNTCTTGMRACRWRWLGLAWLFVFLSVDEMTSIHERLMGPMRGALYKFGLYRSFLYFAWVVPAVIALVILAVVYFRFWLNLPARTRWLFLLAGGVYVFGAVGLEMVGANFVYYEGITNRTFRMLQPLEELAEMGGLTIFIYALLDYLRGALGRFDLRLR